jgi:hypothetical protein
MHTANTSSALLLIFFLTKLVMQQQLNIYRPSEEIESCVSNDITGCDPLLKRDILTFDKHDKTKQDHVLPA